MTARAETKIEGGGAALAAVSALRTVPPRWREKFMLPDASPRLHESWPKQISRLPRNTALKNACYSVGRLGGGR